MKLGLDRCSHLQALALEKRGCEVKDCQGEILAVRAVKTPEEVEAARADGFTCTTTLSTQRQDGVEGFDRSLPERVYRCEKNGIVLESRNPPARGVWMPGINPPDNF